MDTNKMREAFAEFVRRKPRHLRDAYQRAFEAGWQASREAVVIDLPSVTEVGGLCGMRYWTERQVITAVEAEGLRVAP